MTMSALRASALAIATMLALGAAPAAAQDLSSTISCLRGSVPASDYAEFGAKLKETNWDSKGGVSLISNVGGLKLRVTDPSGASVCDETANNTTSCTFKVDLASYEEFNVTVDNVDVPQENGYRLCAF